MSAGTGGMSRDAEQLVRTIGSQADTAANTTEFVRAWVVDEVDGMVQIRLGDEVNVSSGDTARYRRLLGPPLTPGQAVQCVRVPGGYIVLGPIQQGAGDLAGIRIEKGGVPILTTRTTRAIDVGAGLLATAEDAAAPDTDTDEVNVSVDFGTGAGQVPDASTVQRHLTLWSSPAAGGAIASIVTNPNLLVAQDAGGLVVTTPNSGQADLAVNWGTAAGTDSTKVPRNSETARRFDVNQDTTLVLTNPDHFRIGDNLTATVDGGGVRLDAAGGSDGPTLQTRTGTWLSIHNTWPTRNATPVTVALVANQLYGTTFRVREGWACDRIAYRVMVAGTNMRWACFRLDDDTGLTLTPYFQSGTDSVTATGIKNTTFAWGNTTPGIYAFCFLANAAVSLSGIAATGAAEGPWGGGYDPVASYNTGSAIPTYIGFQKAMTYGDLGSPITLTISDLKDQALPVGWVLADPIA